MDEVRAEVERAVDAYQRVALLGEEIPLVDPGEMGDRVLRSITDFGGLEPLARVALRNWNGIAVGAIRPTETLMG